jgi:hypothetical protein
MLAIGGIGFALLMLPVAPVKSGLWRLTTKVHDNFAEEIGWSELTDAVAHVYRTLPENERQRTAILAGNYGEAGAINLYGPQRGLPTAISGVNSYWLRGYGNAPPETFIIVGFSRERVDRIFAVCSLAGHVTNREGVENEETKYYPDIFVCSQPRQPWNVLWERLKSFG